MKKMDEHSPPPPTNLSSELHGAFAQLCWRLRSSGLELTDLDAVVIGRVVEAEASLERAKAEAAQSPLTIDSKANGLTINPVHKLVASAEANLRAWIKLLPKTSNGGHPVYAHTPHVVPSTADVAPVVGLVAGGVVVAGGEPTGEPPERVQRLRELLKEFRNQQSVASGAVTEAENVAE